MADNTNNKLCQATESGDVARMKQLIEEGADVDAFGITPTSAGSHTPLMFAVYHGHYEAAKILIDAGADVNAAHFPDHSVLYHALESPYLSPDIVELLTKSGADVNWIMGPIGRFAGYSPIMFAAEGKQAEQAAKVTHILIQTGISLNTQSPLGETALCKAAKAGNLEAAKLLIDAGADVTLADNKGRTALALASQSGLIDIVYILLTDYDIDVNEVDEDGIAALMYASEEGHVDIMKILLDAGADVKVVDKFGRSALSLAKKMRKQEAVELLIEAGAEE